MKGIKREFSVARTLKQNRVAKRKNRTLIEAARTMLADSLLPTTFWAEAVNTACYVQNRVLVTKPHNKTPYELLHGRPPSISFMRPFGCHVTILNTLDPLGKFDGKADEGFLVGYSINSKAFRVFNTRTRKVEENLHITFLENRPNVAGSRPDWLFDIDLLINSMNYEPVTTGNQTNRNAGIKDNVDAVPTQKYILLLIFPNSLQSLEDAVVDGAGKKITKEPANKAERMVKRRKKKLQIKKVTRIPSVSVVGQSFVNNLPTDPLVPDLEDTTDLLNTGIFSGAYDDEDVAAEADLNNLETTMNVSPIPTTRIHKDHPKDQIIRDINSATQTRRMTNISEEHAMVNYINKQRRTNDKDYQNCLFAYFLSQIEPKKVTQALTDPSWIEVMQDELLQFRLHKVWILVDLPKGKHAIGTKWVYRNKKDERGIVVRNKARLVAQGYTQEEGIDYDEVFAPIAIIEAIRLFLAYASFMGFIVYQMDVKSAFIYGTIKEEVYVCQPPGFEDPQFPDKFYKVEKALYGLHQAPRAWYETLSTYLLENGFRRGTIDKTLFIKKDKGDILLVQMSSMGELTFFLGLQVKQKDDGIFISQDKYVADILKKFDFVTMKTASTPIETNKALLKDEEAEDVDVHLYRSMIGSLMYLTASRPDIMFAVCACARFQVTPKVSHLHVVKRIFRYLKGQPKLGLWYPRDSPFDLEAFLDSDYAGASLDRKSTIGGCQFLGKRLISWQCKKQTVVANSTTKAEYVAAANFFGQVLWIQNQMLDYGFNFMNTKIYIDNESIICIVKNPAKQLFLPKTKHIEIRHHFIRDSYEKRLIQVIKIHTDHNVANLLTKAFDIVLVMNLELKLVVVKLMLLGRIGQALQEDTQLPQTSVHIPNIVDEVVFKEWDDRVVRATTTAASLDAVHASGNISKTQSTTISNDLLSHEIGSGGNTPGSDEERLEQDDLTDFVPLTPHDSPFSGGHTPGSDEVIQKLKKKVKRLEKKQRERTPGMKLFNIGTSKRKILDKENVSKQGTKSDKTKPMFEDSDFAELDMENVEGDVETQEKNTTEHEDTVNTVSIDVSAAGPSNVSTARDIFEDEMVTIADTLGAIRSTRPRTTSVVIHDVEEEPMRATPVPTVQSQDKEISQKLFKEQQAQFEREQRIAREKATEQEAKDAALIEQMEDIQARIDANELLAERLQQEEREQFTIEEKSRMLVEMIAERKRFFAAQRAE
ncbi:putative ribonuclease H-like domain-containing protein, partial [Tanacetum coccineum]